MISLRRTWVPLVVAALVLAPVTSAGASTPAAGSQTVVDLSFDVFTTLLAVEGTASEDSTGQTVYRPQTFSRPTAAPLSPTNPLTLVGSTLTPGTTVIVSVFSHKTVDDSVCLTGTSTKTSTVVYFASDASRPSLVRPSVCAKPGGKAMLTKPSKALLAQQLSVALLNDLRSTSISEESYSTDNNGAFVADVLSRPTKAALPSTDPLVQEGERLNVGDSVVVTVFTTYRPNDSFCITGTQAKPHRVLYLSSVSDTATKHLPRGCVAP